jgi:hypothetical protein
MSGCGCTGVARGRNHLPIAPFGSVSRDSQFEHRVLGLKERAQDCRRLRLSVPRGMTQWLFHALMAALAVASPAVAQTAPTSGSVTLNRPVTLGAGSSASTVAPTSYGSPAGAALPTNSTTSQFGGSATGSTGGTASASGSSGSQSSAAGGARVTSSTRAGSGGSSGSAATAPSGSVPGWVLCPPSGTSGLQPFLTGTGLSCAP